MIVHPETFIFLLKKLLFLNDSQGYYTKRLSFTFLRNKGAAQGELGA